MKKLEPFNYSRYERTGNKAIDLVAQAVGHSKLANRPIEAILLNRAYYGLFWAGIEIMAQKLLPKDHQLEFEGVRIIQGTMYQIENMKINYRQPAPKAINN